MAVNYVPTGERGLTWTEIRTRTRAIARSAKYVRGTGVHVKRMRMSCPYCGAVLPPTDIRGARTYMDPLCLEALNHVKETCLASSYRLKAL